MSENILFEIPFRNLDYFASGLIVTLHLCLLAIALSFLIGIIVALGRISKKSWISMIFGIYVEFTRNTPCLVQIFIVYFTLPTFGIALGSYEAALVALSFNTGAYLSVVIQAGIESTKKGQWEAALSLGMSHIKALRYVVLKPAFKTMFPALGNQFISLILWSSLASAIGVEELFHQGQRLDVVWARSMEIYLVTGLIYLGLASGFTYLFGMAGKLMFKYEV